MVGGPNLDGPVLGRGNIAGQREGVVEVRVWNPHADRTAGATIAARRVTVEPAGIVTFI